MQLILVATTALLAVSAVVAAPSGYSSDKHQYKQEHFAPCKQHVSIFFPSLPFPEFLLLPLYAFFATSPCGGKHWQTNDLARDWRFMDGKRVSVPLRKKQQLTI
ncbi:hypothetical protein DFS34DRAFT_616036 [Phlyctochytrium arcticum]|nr:hypothetical protein DFS34DRAFT_616036 [Phlyctochytrium arcticum]